MHWSGPSLPLEAEYASGFALRNGGKACPRADKKEGLGGTTKAPRRDREAAQRSEVRPPPKYAPDSALRTGKRAMQILLRLDTALVGALRKQRHHNHQVGKGKQPLIRVDPGSFGGPSNESQVARPGEI